VKIIAIDPGKTGALALMEDTRIIEVVDMPVLGDTYNYRGVLDTLHDFKLQGAEQAILEYVLGFTGGGTNPMASKHIRTLGIGLGLLYMALTATEIRWEEVTPSKWKSGLNLKTGVTKKDHAALAHQLFPAHTSVFTGARGGIKDGRVDAVLIGEWYLRQMRGETVKKSTKAKEAA